jgi:hypothetical protein
MIACIAKDIIGGDVIKGDYVAAKAAREFLGLAFLTKGHGLPCSHAATP